MRTRFAPSPTGELHLGGALVALASWLLARAAGGTFVVRIEDLDPPRVVPGAAEAILDDLAWLGLEWDEGPRRPGECAPYTQSARAPLYRAAVDLLASRGLVYPCDCSRQDVARAASAPHAGEERAYPGTCRNLDPKRALRRPPALRFRAPAADFGWNDLVRGPCLARADVAGDFVLVRADGLFAYQLAAAVDDAAMGLTHVVRGDDLLSSTPRQLALLSALGMPAARAPRYGHLPIVRGPDGERLTKRTPSSTVRGLRDGGATPAGIAGLLGRALGLVATSAPVTLEALAAGATGDWLVRATAGLRLTA